MRTFFATKTSKKFSFLAIAALFVGSLVALTPAVPAVAGNCAVAGPTTFTSGSSTYSAVAIKDGTACTWTAPAGVTSLAILAVGGGGGGSSRHGGGGNAGEFLETTSAVTESATLTITIGAGGAGGSGATGGNAGANGTDTTISGSGLTPITATAGQGGSFAGGGLSGNGFVAGAGASGGSCPSIDSGWCGGGGAGSTENGQAADSGNNNHAGYGGAGSTASIYTSTDVSSLSIPTQFAGGGGGGAETNGTAGNASFGGGAGSAGPLTAANASPNTGGGGGGSGYLNTGGQGAGGAGAAGVVVIRWVVPVGSAKFNGSDQYLTVPSSADWNIGTGDFTVEWFQYQTSATSFPRIFSFGSHPTADLAVSIETSNVYIWLEGQYVNAYNLGAQENYFHKWVHFAVTRSSGTLALYYEGQRVFTTSNSTNIQTDSNSLKIGIDAAANTAFPGYLSNFHFVNGTSLYSGATISRPSSPISAVANTKLLLNFVSSSNLLTDSSGTSKTVTNVGSVAWDANNPFSTTVPTAPTLNSATATSGGASLSVSIPSYNGGSPVTSYEYQLDSGTWVSTGNTTLPITLSGLTVGQAYTVKVRAVNSVGPSAESVSRSFTPLKATQTVTWVPSTTTGLVLTGSIAVSAAATSNGDGSITYAVSNAGTTGCAYDSGTRVLTYSAAGTCVVRATAATTATYNSATSDVSFVISKSTQSITWSPTTSIVSNESPKALSVAATALDSAIISYSVNNAGTTGCTVNSTTGTITFTAVGTCVVRTTAAATTAYNSGTRDVSFVISAPTTYTVTYNYVSANGGDSTPSAVFTVGGSGVTLPTPTRTSYVFDGWYTATTGGTKVGNAAAAYTPSNNITLYARWVQKSLWNMGTATKIGNITTVSGIGNTYSASGGGTSVSLSYQADALPAATVIDVYLVADTSRASQLITSTNSFVVNLVVAWKAADETVPTTAGGKPLSMTITNPAIKRGQKIYALLGDVVTDLGIATADGTATFEITDDPEIVIANTKPDAPTSVLGTAGSSKVTVRWSAPSSNGGAAITSYTVTASNGSTCTSATTSCEISGLTNGTAYTFTVTATNTIGTSSASASSASVTPAETVSSPGGSSGGSGSGSGVPAGATPYVPVETSKPTPSQGAVALIGGEAAEVVVKKDSTATSVVVEIKNADIEVKLVAPTGSANAVQGLMLTGTQGDQVHFDGGGLAPLSEVKVYLFSTPTFLGTVLTNEAGEFSGAFSLPSSVAIGQHTLQFGGYFADGKVITTSLALLVQSKASTKSFRVYFAAGSVSLSAAAKTSIAKAFKLVANKPGLTVVVVGFAQKTNYSSKDLVVAKARAASVSKYLKTIAKKLKVVASASSPAKETASIARRAELKFSWAG